MKNKVYFASFFFDTFGYEGSAKMVKEIRDNTDSIVYLPQENGDINDKSKGASRLDIYHGDTMELLKSDIIVAYLDGVEIDAGVATEIGYVAGFNESMERYTVEPKKKFIIGIYSDMRRTDPNNPMYKNLFTLGAIERHGVIVKDYIDAVTAINLYNEGWEVDSIRKYFTVSLKSI